MSHGDLRQFLRDAEQLGFVLTGRDGRNHIRLHNPDSGQSYSAAYSPSDWRSTRNAIAALERLSGRKLPRPKNGKHQHRRQIQLVTELSPAEKRTCRQVAALIEEADSVRRRIDHLMTEPTRDAAAEMRRALTKYGHLRSRLEQLHHIIPPIDAAPFRDACRAR
jgi:hypothetical protein